MGNRQAGPAVSIPERIVSSLCFLGLVALLIFLFTRDPHYASQEYGGGFRNTEKTPPPDQNTAPVEENLFPPGIPDIPWTIDGAVETYTEDQLFEKINGADEKYKLYGNRQLLCASYVFAGKDQEQPDMEHRIEAFVYEMNTQLAALGIFGAERFRGATHASGLGDAGYAMDGSTFFRKGRFYVQLKGYTPEEGIACDRLARYLADKLPGTDSASRVSFSFLPKDDLLTGSERYDPKDGILGTDFLSHIFSAEYGNPDKPAILFVINCQPSASADLVFRKYTDHLAQQGTLLPREEINEVSVQMVDLDGLYEGFFIQSGVFAGVSEAPDQTSLKKYLEALSRSLKGGVVPQINDEGAGGPVLD